MNYRDLGRAGIKVSPICLGNMNFGSPTPIEVAVGGANLTADRGFADTMQILDRGRISIAF